VLLIFIPGWELSCHFSCEMWRMKRFWMFPHRAVFLDKGLSFWGWDGVLDECINCVCGCVNGDLEFLFHFKMPRFAFEYFRHLKPFELNIARVWFPPNEVLKSDLCFSLNKHEPTYCMPPLSYSFLQNGVHTHKKQTNLRDNLHADLIIDYINILNVIWVLCFCKPACLSDVFSS